MPSFRLQTLAAAVLCSVMAGANAFVAVVPDVAVHDAVTATGAGSWTYAYTLSNNTPCFGDCSGTIGGLPVLTYALAVRSFVLPYFSDAGISAITDPAGWTHGLVSVDMFNLGGEAQVIEWRATTDTSGIAVGASLGGFGYLASFSAAKAPFAAYLGGGGGFFGDPAIPLSPLAGKAGLLPLNPVPEPTSLALMAAGLASLWLWRRRGIVPLR